VREREGPVLFISYKDSPDAMLLAFVVVSKRITSVETLADGRLNSKRLKNADGRLNSRHFERLDLDNFSRFFGMTIIR